MTADPEVDTSSATVRTYVPGYQKERWKEHARDLDMSQSEYVRTMVQAGRRVFAEGSPGGTDRPVDEGGGGTGDGDLDDRVIRALSASDYMSWDDLVRDLTDDLESRLEETLQALQGENRIQYSGRNGGYTIVGDTDADRQ